MARELTFDVSTLTLGELAAAERASGIDGSELVARTAHRLLLGVFVLRLRSSGQPPSWSELTSLRVLDAQSSLSASEPDSPGATSSD